MATVAVPTEWFAADQGPEKGADAVLGMWDGCGALKVEYPDALCFSAEKGSDRKAKSSPLMRLHREKFLQKVRAGAYEKNVRLQAIGR